MNGILLGLVGGLDRRRGGAAADHAERGPRRDRARRRARRRRRQPRRDARCSARGSRESLNVRGAFLHVATDLAAFAGTALAGALILAHRLGPLRPDREPRRRGADALVGLAAAPRLDRIFLERAPAGIDPGRGRARARRRAGRRRGARSPRLDGDERLPRARLPTCSSSRTPTATRCGASSRRCWPSASASSTRRSRSTTARPSSSDVPFAAVATARLESRAVATSTSTARPRSSPAPPAGSARRPRGCSRRRASASPAARGASSGSRRDIALELDVTDPESCARFVAAARRRARRIDILVNNAGLALGRVPVRRVDRGGRGAVFETNVHGLMRMTRLCLPHIRDGGHIVNIGSIAGRQAYQNGAVYVAVEVRGARLHATRCARTCSAGRSASPPSTPGSAETEFSLVRFKGDEEKANAVYEGVDAAHRRGHRRLHPLRAHPPAAREHRRDRRQGARAVERRAHRSRPQRRDGADDPRRLDVLHLRRARRRRRRRRAASSRDDTRFLSRLRLTINGERAAAALVRQGRVLLGRVLPPQPARRRRCRRTRSRSRASASSATAMQDRIVVAERERWSRSRSSSRSRSARDFADIFAVKEYDFALGDPLHAPPLPALVDAALRRRRRTSSSSRDPDGERRDAGDPLASPARSTAAASATGSSSTPRERWELRVDVVPSRRTAPRSCAATSPSGASARSVSHVRDSLDRLAAARAAAPRRAGTTLEHAVRPVGRRPRLAADARRRARGHRPAARGRDAVVHDRVRPRHADHVAPDAALRAGARARRARGARRAPGDRGRRRRSTPSRGRSSTRCATARRRRRGSPRYYGTVDATPLYLVLLSEVWRWTDDTRARRASCASRRCAALEWIDALRRPRRRRLRRVRAAHRARAREPVVEGLGRLAALRRRAARAAADRAVRGAGLRLRREAAHGRARARGLARPRARRPARAGGGRAAASASTRRSGSRSAAATTRSRSTATSSAVDSMCSNIGHLLWSGIVPDERVDAVVDRLMGDALWSGWGVRTMSADDAAYNPLSVPQRHRLAARQLPDRARASRATAAGRRRSGSSSAMLEAAAPLRLPAAGGVRRAAARARRRSRSPTRPPRGRRRGRPATPVLLLQVLLGLQPDRRGHALETVAPLELPSLGGLAPPLRRARVRPRLGRPARGRARQGRATQ